MIILTLRTDKPDAELGLYDNDKELAYQKWPAHRELSSSIHKKIEEILNKSSISLEQVGGIVVFKGPGSFTGLRIGLAVANTLADGLDVPIVAESGENWRPSGIKSLQAGGDDKIALPEYGRPARITTPRK